DNSTLTVEIHILESDPGQTAVLEAFKSASTKNYKIESPGKTRTFNATCTKFPTVPEFAIDGVQTGSIEWQINGDVTVAEA
ncbi:MAG: hypothetical protein FWD70_07330, partial [Desulfuromonadales bacterium]|nr:hypothetical protein [Desulfuromonadales bacterium]